MKFWLLLGWVALAWNVGCEANNDDESKKQVDDSETDASETDASETDASETDASETDASDAGQEPVIQPVTQAAIAEICERNIECNLSDDMDGCIEGANDFLTRVEDHCGSGSFASVIECRLETACTDDGEPECPSELDALVLDCSPVSDATLVAVCEHELECKDDDGAIEDCVKESRTFAWTQQLYCPSGLVSQFFECLLDAPCDEELQCFSELFEQCELLVGGTVETSPEDGPILGAVDSGVSADTDVSAEADAGVSL